MRLLSSSTFGVLGSCLGLACGAPIVQGPLPTETPPAAALTADAPPATSAAPSGPLQVDPQADPTIALLGHVVESGKCVRLERMPDILSRLPDPEFRIQLGKVASEGNRHPGPALTEWLVLASQYQEICQLHGAEDHEAAKYVVASVPIEEKIFEQAVNQGRCGFLAAADTRQAWPYEVRMGQEVLRREFNEAEITRQLWKSMLQDYIARCGETLSRRGQIRAETTIRRLDRIIGLDDPTLIDMRSNMLTALEAGNEKKVLAYAKAISEREASLDSMRAGEYEQKLASIESELAGQRKVMAEQAAQMKAAVVQAGANGAMAGQTPAEASANLAETAQNVAQAAEAAKTTAQILRAFF